MVDVSLRKNGKNILANYFSIKLKQLTILKNKLTLYKEKTKSLLFVKKNPKKLWQ